MYIPSPFFWNLMFNSFPSHPHVKAITFLMGEEMVVVCPRLFFGYIIMFLISLSYFEFFVVKPAPPIMLILFLKFLRSIEDFNLNFLS